MRNKQIISTFLFCVSLFAVPGKAQQSESLIAPGKGVGELYIGMKYKAVQKLMGKPEDKNTEKEERSDFVSSGYQPDDFLVFRSGFDECCTYPYNNKCEYPVFKIYFRKKKVCYIVISGAGYGSVRAGRFVTRGNTGFNSNKEDMLKEFGKENHFNQMANYDGEYVYYANGISFVIQKDGSIISMDIFPVMTVK